jgi:hypothetical protein
VGNGGITEIWLLSLVRDGTREEGFLAGSWSWGVSNCQKCDVEVEWNRG